MTIGDWLDTAYTIERRRLSAAKYEARSRHMRAFPMVEIVVELDLQLLERVVAMLKGPPHHFRTGFAQPHCGARGAAPQTPIIVAVNNRVTRLRAAGVGGNLPPPD